MVSVGGNTYKTKTSLYKGDITLEFVMDDPYWYSIKSIITEDVNPENLKVVLEDGVPHFSMLQNSCFLADNKYFDDKEGIKEQEQINLLEEEQESRYLYYCGSASAKPIISFDMEPIVNSDTGLVSFWKNGSNNNYCLNIGNEKTLEFTLPGLFSSYNKALEIVANYPANSSILDLRAELRDSIYNYYTRSYIMSIIDFAKNNRDYTTIEGIISSSFKEYFISKMKTFFPKKEEENSTEYKNFSFKIDNKTGEVVISGEINLFTSSALEQVKSQAIIENAGNMIKSNYLSIDTRCLPKNGFISSGECLPVSTNSNLLNLKINYKNMYL